MSIVPSAVTAITDTLVQLRREPPNGEVNRAIGLLEQALECLNRAAAPKKEWYE